MFDVESIGKDFDFFLLFSLFRHLLASKDRLTDMELNTFCNGIHSAHSQRYKRHMSSIYQTYTVDTNRTLIALFGRVGWNCRQHISFHISLENCVNAFFLTSISGLSSIQVKLGFEGCIVWHMKANEKL